MKGLCITPRYDQDVDIGGESNTKTNILTEFNKLTSNNVTTTQILELTAQSPMKLIEYGVCYELDNKFIKKDESLLTISQKFDSSTDAMIDLEENEEIEQQHPLNDNEEIEMNIDELCLDMQGNSV